MFRIKHKFPLNYKILFLIVLVISIFLLLQNYLIAVYTEQSTLFSWEYYSLVPIIDYSLWALFAPYIYALSMEKSLINKLDKSLILRHIFYSIIFVIIHRFTSNALQSIAFYFADGIWLDPYQGYMLRALISGVVLQFVVYWIMIGLFSVFQYQQGLRQKEIELTRLENELNTAQLNALKMQLNPHFLFNTLHSISALMGKNSKGQKLLSKLGFLLRFMLYKNKDNETTLEDELNYINNYLYIEMIRFQDRLNVKLDIDDETLLLKVPTLILQPLIENSLKHGFSEKQEPGTITIKSSLEKEYLVLSVSDDGLGVDDIEYVQRNPGIGLKNVKERLNYMFKDNYLFEIQSIVNDGFKITIKLPIYRGV